MFGESEWIKILAKQGNQQTIATSVMKLHNFITDVAIDYTIIRVNI